MTRDLSPLSSVALLVSPKGALLSNALLLCKPEVARQFGYQRGERFLPSWYQPQRFFLGPQHPSSVVSPL